MLARVPGYPVAKHDIDLCHGSCSPADRQPGTMRKAVLRGVDTFPAASTAEIRSR
jgi:hypothetical protein